jgi:hypothetical protein
MSGAIVGKEAGVLLSRARSWELEQLRLRIRRVRGTEEQQRQQAAAPSSDSGREERNGESALGSGR